MNSLSWMIYAAEVLGSLQITFAIIGFVSLFGGAIVAFFAVIADAADIPKAVLAKWWIPVLCFILASALPSSTTVYMIAASEAGETIVKSQEAKEVFDDLKTIIKSKLKEQLPKA